MTYYEFSQNNSFGEFDYDEAAGISHYLVIEASDTQEAERRFWDIVGSYGASGDCPCCGSRWSSYFPSEVASPEAFVKERSTGTFLSKWMKGYELFAHHADGRIEGLWAA